MSISAGAAIDHAGDLRQLLDIVGQAGAPPDGKFATVATRTPLPASNFLRLLHEARIDADRRHIAERRHRALAQRRDLLRRVVLVPGW